MKNGHFPAVTLGAFGKWGLPLVALLLLTTHTDTFGQCSITSSTGYTVHVDLTLRRLVKPGSCPHGYNYNLEIGYTTWFTGSNIPPGGLYTLQGNAYCGAQNLFFDIPNTESSGIMTTTANPWRGTSDCGTATLSSLNCRNIQLQVHGIGIPNQTVNCSAYLLPIELISFEAKPDEDGVRLNWITASEVNNDHFTVERSMNAIDFEPAVRVPAIGNSTIPSEYIARDDRAVPGVVYYRLRQTDEDGTSTTSDVVAVERVIGNSISLYPNPIDQGTLWLNGKLPSGRAEILSSTGRVLRTTQLSPGIGVDGLAPGAYVVRVLDTAGQMVVSLPFMKI